jgi:hypothetical protein
LPSLSSSLSASAPVTLTKEQNGQQLRKYAVTIWRCFGLSL